ncbi:hypothetical protein MGSAQ_000672, partial [marine sediment metagenome]
PTSLIQESATPEQPLVVENSENTSVEAAQ